MRTRWACQQLTIPDSDTISSHDYAFSLLSLVVFFNIFFPPVSPLSMIPALLCILLFGLGSIP